MNECTQECTNIFVPHSIHLNLTPCGVMQVDNRMQVWYTKNTTVGLV